MSDHKIQPIETRYKGYRFRSRLEARWAVFYDTIGIPWVYEKEGFDLGDGVLYLPDFWMPRQDCWIEIKGSEASPQEQEKARRLAKHTGKFVFMFFEYFGPCEQVKSEDDWDWPIVGSNLYFAPSGSLDGCMSWGVCPKCGELSIGHHGTHAVSYDRDDENRGCGKYTDCEDRKIGYVTTAVDTVYGENVADRHPRLMKAYAAARAARFEHGEKP